MEDCNAVRELLSALRDGEQADATMADVHVHGCMACRAWLDDLDKVTARQRLAVVRAPDLRASALSEWDRQAAAPGRLAGVWRWLLAGAGMASVLVSVPRLFTGLGPWVWGPAHAHHVREIAAVELALGLGFLLAAWRPSRFSAGLSPVCVLLVVVLGAVITVDTLAGNTVLISELVHVPVVVGTVALGLVERRAGNDPGPGKQWAQASRTAEQDMAA